MKCSCGSHFFHATRVKKVDVTVSSLSDAEYTADTFEEYLEQEVQCAECGKSYTLDQISEPTKVELTEKGREVVAKFLANCVSLRIALLGDKEDDTELPTVKDILDDIACFEDEDKEYYNCWGVTDDCNSQPLCLKRGEDYVIERSDVE